MYLKEKVFKEELKMIQTPKYREFATALVNRLPDYFFEVAASSTGKYHSESCIGSGGLIRHTKAALMIAQDLFRDEAFNHFSVEEQDFIIISLMFHDGWKHGVADLNDSNFSKYTRFEHPLVAAEMVKSFADNFDIDEKSIDLIYHCIASHMGPWTTSSRSELTLPEPKTEMELFVHMCDYMASRSYLIYKFSTPYDPAKFRVSENEKELQEKIAEIIDNCKQAVKNSLNPEQTRQQLFDIIKKHNDNNRNPKNIKSIDVARKILNEVKDR